MPAADFKNLKTWEARKQRFDEVFSMCLEGKTLSEIGSHYGISKQAVSGFLRGNANPAQFALIQESFNKRVPAVRLKDDIIAGLQSGLTCSEIAKSVNCHVSTVKRVSAHWRKSNKTAA